MPDKFLEILEFEELIPKRFNKINERKTTGNINSKNVTINTLQSSNEITNPKDRMKLIMEKINTKNLNEFQINEIQKICLEYCHAFYIEGDNLKPTNAYEHSIKLKPEVDNIFIRQYRLPETQKTEIKKQVQQLLSKNIIEKSTSKFNSPMLLVKKKSDNPKKFEFRLVIDYRKLNKGTIAQAYPMPLIDEISDKLYNSKSFTVLDVFSAFHQIELTKECRHLTAFSTDTEHYQFKRVPFGLQSSPIAWLYTINRVLRDFSHKKIFCYMDDIIIHENNDNQNLILIKTILKQLIKFNIKLKPEKCNFLQKSVTYLGYKISDKGLEIDESKMRCIKEYPKPKNIKEVMRFCGFTSYYRKWIFNFAKIAKPLYNLLKKEVNFEWNSNCENAFQTLKLALITPPVLAFPNFELDFILATDASNIACSGILSNRENKTERPIQYFSRSLNETQSKYSAIELELLAIVWSIEWFRPYLYGRKFFIFTDHKPLIYLFGNNNMNARLHRWRLLLMEYQFEIIHREGKANQGPDALSRIQIEIKENQIQKTIFMVKTRANQNITINDNVSKNNNINKKTGKNTLYYIEENSKIIINKSDYDHIFFFIQQK